MSVCSCRVLIHVLCQFYMNPPENNHLIFESSFYLVKLDSFITEMGKWVTCVRRGVHLFQNWAFKVGQNEYILMGDDYCIHTKGTSTTSDVFYEPWLQNEKHTPFCCTWRESASINFLSLIWFLMKFCQHLITILLSDLYVVICSTLLVFV